MLNAWKFLLDGQQVLASTSTQCLLQTTQKRHHPLIQYNKYNLHCSEKPTTNPYPYRPPLTNPQKPTHQTPTKKTISHYPTTKTQHTNPLLIFFHTKRNGSEDCLSLSKSALNGHSIAPLLSLSPLTTVARMASMRSASVCDVFSEVSFLKGN